MLGRFLGERRALLPRADRLKAQQCSQAALPLYPGRTYTFWPDRMSQASCFSPLLRQTAGLFGNHAAARRKPGGFDSRHQLFEEVC
jgi:hypothetical protein